MALGPVETSTMYDQVYARLRAALMMGRFRPGDRVTVRGLADMLGVSPMPVRNAVSRLVTSRALEMPNSRATRVPLFSLERFSKVHNLRLLLESAAAAEAATRLTKDEIGRLEQLQERMERRSRSGDEARVLELNQEFHFAIYRAAGNELAVDMIETLWLMNGPYLRLFADTRTPLNRPDFSHHTHLLAALAQRDGAAAAAALREDLEAAKERIFHEQSIRCAV